MNRFRIDPAHPCHVRAVAGGGAAGDEIRRGRDPAGGSCGKDIDDNCRGVNLDPTRLKECLYRNGTCMSAKCQDDYPRAPSAIQQRITARSTLLKLCNWEMNHLCGEVRADPAKGLQCLLNSTKKATAELQQGDQCGGVSLMGSGIKLRDVGLLLGVAGAVRRSGRGIGPRRRCRPATSSTSWLRPARPRPTSTSPP